jgi:hypothetical protein
MFWGAFHHRDDQSTSAARRIAGESRFNPIPSFALPIRLQVSIGRSLTPFSSGPGVEKVWYRGQLGARLTARLVSRNVVDFPEFLAINHKASEAKNHQQYAC